MRQQALRPFLGETTDRKSAFPGIKSLSVKIAQDPYGCHCREQWMRENSYSKLDIPRYQKCKNPRCQQGGLDLQMLVWNYGNIEAQTFYCNGHEGTPKGRRKGAPCTNVFTITIKTEAE